MSLTPPPGYIFGCLPRTDRPGETFALSSRYQVYPRSQWPELAATNQSAGLLANRVYNQLQEGSCNCQAGAQAMTLTMSLINKDWTPPDGFSGMPPYKALARGPNQGTVIGEVLVYLRDKGTLPIDTPRNREWMRRYGFNSNHVMPETGYYTPMPAGCAETQLCFRIADARDCTQASEIIAAVFDNKVGVLGVDMHAMCYIQTREENGWLVDIVNSWGNWGKPLGPPPAIQYGRGSIAERKIDAQIRQYGAYTIETMYIPPQFTRN